MRGMPLIFVASTSRIMQVAMFRTKNTGRRQSSVLGGTENFWEGTFCELNRRTFYQE